MDPLVIRLDFLEFPPSHTCDGANISPRIRISGLRAASVAMMAVNPFQPACCSFCPWLIWNLPPGDEIPAGIPAQEVVSSPVPAVQRRNDFGQIGYSGPCPPWGATDQQRLAGNDQLVGLRDNAEMLEKSILEWNARKDLIGRRLPGWTIVQRMAKHAPTLPDAAEPIAQLTAITDGRLLLEPMDPVASIRRRASRGVA